MDQATLDSMARSRKHRAKPRVVSDDVVGVGHMVLHVTRYVVRGPGVVHITQPSPSAYTMFNVYYPKLLETGIKGDAAPKSLEDNLWDIVIFTLAGCPGAIVRYRPYFHARNVWLTQGHNSSGRTWWKAQSDDDVRWQ